jgi:hypothetical protein
MEIRLGFTELFAWFKGSTILASSSLIGASVQFLDSRLTLHLECRHARMLALFDIFAAK